MAGTRPSKPAADDVTADLAALGKAASANARTLTDGAIPCSIPQCGGIVKAAYVLRLPSGKPVGRCVNRTLHEALAARDPRTKAVSQGLTSLYLAARLRGLTASSK